ncbi:hypothetical protein EON79_17510 [bacterium]|nr:MAG: hypothetical protein EON79_17510 [bacterium]
MKTPTILAAMCLAGAAFAQETATSSVTAMSTSRSEVGAIASILSRLNDSQGRIVVRVLENLENRGNATTASAAYGMMATEKLLLDNVDASDHDAFASTWGAMNSFDKESLAILARDAYFGGINDDGSTFGGGRALSFFAPGSTPRPQDLSMMPEQRIIENLAIKLGDQGQVMVDAIMKIQEMGGKGMSTLSYMNAEKTLVEAIDADKRDAFVSKWKSLDYSDREAVATIVRDAYYGGIADL